LRGKVVHQPKERMHTIKSLFDHFCTVYPEAVKDPEVIEQFIIQYARTIIKSKPKKIAQTLSCLKSTWPAMIKTHRAFYYLFRNLLYGIQWNTRG